MFTTIIAGILYLGPLADTLETRFEQVHPPGLVGVAWQRSAGQKRAVVNIHGFVPRPFSEESVSQAALHFWQRPTSALVKKLGQSSDVFAFAYGQNLPVGRVAESTALNRGIEKLHRLGYKEIVLLGHSAGGLIARQFVEDHPGSPVTKVIQVAAPNGGTSLSKLRISVQKTHEPFLESLTNEARAAVIQTRAGKLLPEDLQFACIIANGLIYGDGVILCVNQWTDDLQSQGVPAFAIPLAHFRIPLAKKGIALIDRLVREPLPRWGAEQVQESRNIIFDPSRFIQENQQRKRKGVSK